MEHKTDLPYSPWDDRLIVWLVVLLAAFVEMWNPGSSFSEGQAQEVPGLLALASEFKFVDWEENFSCVLQSMCRYCSGF